MKRQKAAASNQFQESITSKCLLRKTIITILFGEHKSATPPTNTELLQSHQFIIPSQISSNKGTQNHKRETTWITLLSPIPLPNIKYLCIKIALIIPLNYFNNYILLN